MGPLLPPCVQVVFDRGKRSVHALVDSRASTTLHFFSRAPAWGHRRCTGIDTGDVCALPAPHFACLQNNGIPGAAPFFTSQVGAVYARRQHAPAQRRAARSAANSFLDHFT